jgi:GGDEF domain-containing protein
VITGIEVPLEMAVLLCTACMVAGAWAGKARASRRPDPHRHALSERLGDLLQSEAKPDIIDLAARRDAGRAGSHAVLQGRIDRLGTVADIWTSTTQGELRENVAAVMRAGLRRDDRVTLEKGAGFTITMPGIDERAAVRVADRLRRRLAQLTFPHLGNGVGVTASFGVAARRYGDTDHGVARRARRALDAALAKGEDHVVPASEIEEIMLLPAPAPSTSAA